MTGTSMATPHVAGVMAYFISIYPDKTFKPRFQELFADEVDEQYLTSIDKLA
jgi:subtilisin family serine protease